MKDIHAQNKTFASPDIQAEVLYCKRVVFLLTLPSPYITLENSFTIIAIK